MTFLSGISHASTKVITEYRDFRDLSKFQQQLQKKKGEANQ